MQPTNGENRRRVFRLRLPADSPLTAKIAGKEHKVLEVAEYSIWVASENVKNFNGICAGVIRWSNGKRSNFSGEVGRLNDGGRVIWKVEGISMPDVITEQRFLLAKFPGLHERRAA